MDKEQAIEVLIEAASTWAENVEEDFIERIQVADSDEILAHKSDNFALAKTVRDVWRAVAVLRNDEAPTK